MIDPRISLAAQAPDFASGVTNAINIFENALMNSQSRDLRQKQEARTAELHPLSVQATKQGVESNQNTLDTNREQRIVKSLNDFAVGNASIISDAVTSKDPAKLQDALIKRRSQLVSQGLPTETTDEGIAMLGQGNIDGVVSALKDGVNLYNQGRGQGDSAGTREFQNLLRIAQDPNSTELEVNSAKRALGDMPNASGGVAKVIDVGGVPHNYDPVTQIATPLSIGGENVTTDTVAESKATIGGRGKAVSAAVDFAKTSNNRIAGLESLNDQFDSAIKQLDSGAETGVIDQMLPSINNANIILDNVASQAGFDLAKSGGGIITEADMAWGLRTAIPQGLPPTELREFLIQKQQAQTKIINHLKEVTTFLGDGQKTIPDWYKHQKTKSDITKKSDDDLLGGF